ncbi:MAG: transposase [Chloroflexi bacterium]|nr:transposase [Chloroflexota bacterium]
MNENREYYHRHLPHWQPTGATFFVTFRLKGTLPVEVMKALKEEQEREKKDAMKLIAEEQIKQNYVIERRYFGRWDNLLDAAGFGPRWLTRPEIAEVLKEALFYRDGCEYDLFAFSIMSNHVHVVFSPLDQSGSLNCQHLSLQESSCKPLDKIMQSLKRHTARRSNIILGREGAFWQDESYDHVIRNNGEFERIVSYVLENPVKAGLVSKWEDWPWTFCKAV